jgi:gamma-glutamyltranspeptidase/glutathione hydrolase
MNLPRLLAVVAALTLGLVHSQLASAQAPPQEPTAVGRGGGAASVDVAGTQAAIHALRHGGNAVDAAVAAAAVLGVTEPYSCGIGGGGFMVIRTPDGKVTTIDSREESPAAMRPDSFFVDGEPLDPSDDDDFDLARYSGLSAGVPGSVAGWERALRHYGSWSLKRALRSGVRVARRGFEVDDTFVSQTEPNVEWFDDIPSTAAIYLDPDGTPRDVGSTLRNLDLARTYELIGDEGARGFYRGDLAEAMVEAARRPAVAPDADHEWRPGLLTEKDVKRYEALKRDPTRIGYRGLEVWGMGPPSSGGSTVGEALNILEGYDLSAADRTRALHLYLEASRLSYADRSAYIADPAFFDVPLEGLLSDGYAAKRRALIDPAMAGTRPAAAGNPRPYSSTTHLVVSDRAGTVVSYTFTIESTGGNGIVVPGYGFLLNNELTDFNFDSTMHPNRAEGRKRPRSSMAPTIVTKDGEPYLAVGSPGGSTIITTVLQVLLERLDLGASLPEAIAAPRASQRNSETTEAEQAFIDSPEGRALQASYGHEFEVPESEVIGAVTGLEFFRRGRVLAAAEPERRGGGSAAVVRP